MGELDWMAVGIVVVGLLITTGGGLLSLIPDPGRPARFVPVYIVAMALFAGGLWLVVNSEDYSQQLREGMDSQTQNSSTA